MQRKPAGHGSGIGESESRIQTVTNPATARADRSATGKTLPLLLIAEAHEENRRLFKMLLEANGYRVAPAGDGVEALAAARSEPPSAILSDVLMPNMDGFALCRAWMQDAVLKQIPFVFYSGQHARPDEEQYAKALGAARFLAKPLQTEVLLRELRTLLAAPERGAPAA